MEILGFEDREYLALGGDKCLEVFELETNLKAKFLFELMGSVFSLFWEGTYLVVGRGVLKNKQMSGLHAQAIVFHRQESLSKIRSTVQGQLQKVLEMGSGTNKNHFKADFEKQENEQNKKSSGKKGKGNAFTERSSSLENEDLSVMTTKTSFYCMFGTSIGGFRCKRSFEKHVVGVWEEQRSYVVVENLDTGLVTKVKAHTMTVYSIGIESKQNLVVSGGWDKNLAVWSLKHIEGRAELHREGFKEDLHDSWINHIQVLKIRQNLDYKIVLTGGFDHKVKMLSIFTLEELMSFEFSSRVLDCCFIKDKLLVVGEHRKRVRVFYEPDILKHKKETLKMKIKESCRTRPGDSDEIWHLRCLLWESEEIIEELENEHSQVNLNHLRQKKKTQVLRDQIMTMHLTEGETNVFSLEESRERVGKSALELVKEMVAGPLEGVSREDAKKILLQIKLLVEKET